MSAYKAEDFDVKHVLDQLDASFSTVLMSTQGAGHKAGAIRAVVNHNYDGRELGTATRTSKNVAIHDAILDAVEKSGIEIEMVSLTDDQALLNRMQAQEDEIAQLKDMIMKGEAAKAKEADNKKATSRKPTPAKTNS